MFKKSKMINLIGSLIIGAVILLSVLLILIIRGVINATPTKLIFTSESLTATYNGQPLSSDYWELIEGEIKPEHELSVKVSGSQKNVGSSSNLIFVTITDANGADVSSDYEIECYPGVLKVEPQDITVIADSAEKVYDGTPLTAPGYTLEPSIALADGETIEVNIKGNIIDIGEVNNIVTDVKIKDQDGNDTTINYNISTKNGTLKITGYDDLIFKTGTSKSTYNGAPLTNPAWAITSGKLLSGHSAVVTVTGSQTNVGESLNEFTVQILDSAGNDLTAMYSIEMQPGTLTVEKQAVKITSASDEKVYDGNPLTNTEFTLDPSYVQNDNANFQVKITGSQTLLGTSKNTVSSYIVLDKDNIDITDNYDITVVEGELRVVASADALRNKLVFASESDSKFYDGAPLTNNGWSLLSGVLASNHRAEVTCTGSQTTVGSAANTMNAIILDEHGNSVTDKYIIEYECGTLEVRHQELLIISDSNTKVYDGTPLVDMGYTVTPDYVLGNVIISVNVTGTITEKGSAPNTISGYSITDMRGNDVSSNYMVKTSEGTLTVVEAIPQMKTNLVIKSESDKKEYDGAPLTNEKWNIASGALLQGHKIVASVTGSQTNIGSSKNTVSVEIYDEADTLVTESYTIEYIEGTLTVDKATVKITAGSKEKVYDGTPLIDSSFTVSPTHLQSQFRFEVQVAGSQTVIGKSNNNISSYRIYNGNNDVTSAFNVTTQKGTLTVLEPHIPPKPEITISSESAEKAYDGKSLRCDAWSITSGTLKEGHYAVVTLPSYIVTVGSCDNLIEPKILDKNGNNVTNQYIINLDPGTLTVTPVDIVIKSMNGKKQYDGTPLVKNIFSATPENTIPADHRIIVDIVGSQVEIGSSPNTITSWIILDSNNNNVSNCFNATVTEGTLTVTEEPVEEEPELGGGGSGEGGSGEGGSLDLSGGVGGSSSDKFESDKQTMIYYIYSSQSGKVYLRVKSFGDYLGTASDTWADATAYNKLMLSTLPASYLTYFAISSSDTAVSNSIRITPVGNANFALPYYASYQGSYIIPTSDVLNGGVISNPYSLNYFEYVNDASLPSQYADYESLYSAFVYGQYLSIDDYLEEALSEIINEQGWSRDDADIIQKVATYLQSNYTYNLDYNKGMDVSSDLVYSFLFEYKEGICGHYASAATMIFRALGIPARYTVGFVGDAVANEEVGVSAAQAHAWVEVYVDGIGWVMVEVTGGGSAGGDGTGGIPGGGGSGEGGSGEGGSGEGGSGEGGSGEGGSGEGGSGEGGSGEGGSGEGGSGEGENNNKIKITISPTKREHKYDGTTIYAPDKIEEVGKVLAYIGPNSYYEAVVAGERTNPGKTKTQIVSITFYNSDGEDVTEYVNEKFEFTMQEGFIHIYYSELRFSSKSYDKIYDGETLTLVDSDCKYVSGMFVDPSHYYVLKARSTSTIKNVGSQLSQFDVTIYDVDENDITECYKIKKEVGRLTVDPIELTIVAGSATKTYDGTPLKCNEIDYEKSILPLIDGDTIVSFVIKGEKTTMGKADNIIESVTIKNADGENVTSNYTCKFVAGVLQVKLSG